jgi:LL-diaminopimelate aminotransferase
MDSGMFLPVQLAAAKALEMEKQFHDEVNSIYKIRRRKVFELLTLLQCEFDQQQAGMFVWAMIPKMYKDGFALSDKVLRESNVFITPGGIFGSAGNDYVRVSLCSTEDNIHQAITRIKQHFTN